MLLTSIVLALDAVSPTLFATAPWLTIAIVTSIAIAAATVGLAATGGFDPEYPEPPTLDDTVDERKALILDQQRRRKAGMTLLSGTPNPGPTVQVGQPVLTGTQNYPGVEVGSGNV